MSDKDADLQRIKRLIKIMKENELVEIEIKHGDDKISLKRSQPQVVVGQPITGVPVVGPDSAVVSPSPQGQAGTGAAGPTEDLEEIKSPIVGTFYATASPDSEAYVEAGSHVDPQTVVCIIEAMKMFNQIEFKGSDRS